jgi:DNA-binding NarL/FixJ family response regulator
MDLRMPGGDGTTAIRELSARTLLARVLVLTTYDSDIDVVPAIQAGATGYLLKDSPREELFRAVRAADRGESVISPRRRGRRGTRTRPAWKDPRSVAFTSTSKR